MIRLLVSLLLTLAGNAIGLLIAAVVLDDMSLDGAAFLIELLIFTAVAVIARPLITQIGLQHARPLAGSSALVATFVGLVVTTLVSDGLQIRGAVTWLLATVIVWAGALLAGIVLPAVIVKRAVQERRRAPGPIERTWP